MRSQEQTGDNVYFSFSSPVLIGSPRGPPSTKQPSPTGKQHPLEPQKQVRKLEDLDDFQPQETRERKDTGKHQCWGTLSPLPCPPLFQSSEQLCLWGLQYAHRMQGTVISTRSILQAWVEAKAGFVFKSLCSDSHNCTDLRLAFQSVVPLLPLLQDACLPVWWGSTEL